MPARRFTDEQERAIAARYPAENTYQLAKIYNTTPKTISALIKRQGGKLRGSVEAQSKKFTAEQEREIAAQYPEKSTLQLAEIYGTTYTTISSIIKRQGVKIRGYAEAGRRFTDEQEREIAAQYPAKSTSQLAELYNAGVTTIKAILKRQGVKIRSSGEARRRFTAEQEAEIAAQYPAKSTYELAELYNAGITAIINALRRQGVKLRSNSEVQEARRRFTDEQEREIASQYPEKNVCQLAELNDVCVATIIKALEHQGVDRCPVTGYGDSVQHVLDSTGHHQHQRECELYLFELARYSATHCKAGIAFDADKRARESNGEYGEEVLRLFFASRAEAYFLEQAVLDATRGSASCPADLIGWGGHSEVRAMPAADMVPTILRLAEELEELGQWEFAARYVPMTASQRAICQQRAMELVTK